MSAQFAKLPQNLVTDPEVADAAVRVYACLKRHEWAFHKYGTRLPSLPQVAAELSRSADSVRRAVQQLERTGWLTKEVRGSRVEWLRLNDVANGKKRRQAA